MHTVDNRSPPIIQLFFPPSRSPKFCPLTLPLLPLTPVVSQVVISKPQLGELRFTEGDGEVERRQIYFPIRGIHTMLRRPSGQLSAGPSMLSYRLTLNATWKSSRNILSKLTCASSTGGTGTVPFGPMTDPGSDSDGELDEVPLSRPKNSLTAPSTSPVVYKSRPIPRGQPAKAKMGGVFLPSACSIPGTTPSNPFHSFCDLSSLSQKDGENSFSIGDSYITCALLRK